MIFSTEYHDLYLADPSMEFPPLSNIRGRDNYILYESEQMILHQKHTLQSNLCQTQMEEHGSDLIRLKGNNFMKHNADAVKHFLCT